MPSRRPSPRRPYSHADFLAAVNAVQSELRRKRPRRRRGGTLEPEPVEPDKPRPLSGGAQAALEFDD